MSRGLTTIDAFQQLKADSSFELARTASSPGKKRALTGAVGVDADYHLMDQMSYLRMIAFVRMMERNDPVIGSAGQRLMANVNVGQMTPAPDTGSDIVDEHIKGLWKEYAADPDQCDTSCGWSYESQADVAFIRAIFDGDVFVVPGDGPDVMHLEAHRCQSPYGTHLMSRGVCGIEAQNNRPKTFFLSKQSHRYGAALGVQDVVPVPALDEDGWPNVFHVFRPQRFTLTRGVTSLAPCGTAASRRDDGEFATILKQQLSACVSWSEEYTDMELARKLLANGGGGSVGGPLPTSFAGRDDAGFEMDTVAMHPGMMLSPRLGRKLTMHNPNIPGDGFFELNLLLIQYLSICLDIPLIVLLLDARNANFASYRNVMDQARQSYGKAQRWFAARYHRPRYRHFLRRRIRDDKVLSGFVDRENALDLRQSRLFTHTWNAVGWKYYHPVDDAQGDVILVSNSLDDLDRFARRKHGIGGEEHIDRVVKMNAYAVRSALQARKEILREYPDADVDWKHLWVPPNRQGLQLQTVDTPDGRTGDDA